MSDYQDENILEDENLDKAVALDGGPRPEDYDTPEDVVVTDQGIIEAAEMLHKDTKDASYSSNNVEVDERGGMKIHSSKITEVFKERTVYSSKGEFNPNKSAAYEIGVALAGIAEAADAPGNPDFETIADEAAEDAADDLVYESSANPETGEIARDVQEGLEKGAEDGVDYINDQDLDLEDFEDSGGLFSLF
jgi:hypothetical protein